MKTTILSGLLLLSVCAASAQQPVTYPANQVVTQMAMDSVAIDQLSKKDSIISALEAKGLKLQETIDQQSQKITDLDNQIQQLWNNNNPSFMESMTNILGMTAPFAMIILVIYIGMSFGYRTTVKRYETINKYIEHGEQVPAEWMPGGNKSRIIGTIERLTNSTSKLHATLFFTLFVILGIIGFLMVMVAMDTHSLYNIMVSWVISILTVGLSLVCLMQYIHRSENSKNCKGE